ncbi:transcriptional regulator [Salmonella enterica subsp. enterica]|uniref:Transcriptional regulator n=1 Tax=Salmonella enterica I TaxID=59201 RepID=A0A612H7K2_SALET|nr:transcriptional regulator [Salmonella enterica subsp. enterica]
MVTACKRKKIVPQIIIHGDCWPVVNATQHVIKEILPESLCETTFGLSLLLQRLARSPDALLILCLRPREHIFLFYALKNELLCHPVLIISDELLFSDRVVLHYWGEIQAVLHQELTDIVIQIRQGLISLPAKSRFNTFMSAPKKTTGSFSVPLIFNNPKRLMNYMSLLIFREIKNCGVTTDQQKLLEEIYHGRHSLSGLKKVLNKNEKKIFQDKNRLLVKLGMKNRLRELLYGTRFCLAHQRTEFMPPDQAKTVFETQSFAIFSEKSRYKQVNR